MPKFGKQSLDRLATCHPDLQKVMNEADILINKALDNGKDATNLRAYRQALRDATINWVIPNLEDYLNVPNP